MKPQDLPWEMVVSIVFLCVIGAIALGYLLSWHRDKDVQFDLREALVDSVTHKLSVEKIGFMLALLTMSWALVTLTLQGELTEWFVLAYTGPFALARVASQGIAVAKDLKGQTNASNP